MIIFICQYLLQKNFYFFKRKVTKENYRELIAWEKEYYLHFDYDSLYEKNDETK